MRRRAQGETTSRRRFLESLVAAAGSPLAAKAAASLPSAETRPKRARVVVVRSEKALDSRNRPRRAELDRMVERGVALLLGEQKAATAWRKLISPDDTVGLKVNCLGGPRLCTHPALAEAVADNLAAAGIPPEHIIIWDRTDRELLRCGFRLNKAGGGERRCFGTPSFEKKTIRVGGIETRLSTIAARAATASISLPVLKTHTLAGFSGALKNDLGCVANPSDFHPDNCRAAADLCALAAIAEKRRLVICDALRPLFDKGPTDVPRYRWNYGALIFATDPVAADIVGRDILLEKRKAFAGGKSWPLSPPAAYLERAIELGLGVGAPEKIELIEV